MICPYCQTDNRDDREACYYCKKDLSMLRLIVNKAKHHYNQGLEFAERGRVDDAIGELKNALDLDGSMDNAQVVLGTLYAKKEMFAEARECWQRALALNHNLNKAHEYLHKAEKAEYVYPAIHRFKIITLTLGGLLLFALVMIMALSVAATRQDLYLERVHKAVSQLRDNDDKLSAVYSELAEISSNKEASPMAHDLALSVQHRIQRSWQRRLDLASNASRSYNTNAALQILDTLKQENPPIPDIQQSIARITATAQENANQMITESANQFFNGRLPYERFIFEANRYLTYFKEGPLRAKVAELQAKAEKIQNNRLLNEAMEIILNAPLPKAADKLAEQEAKDSKLAQPLRATMEQRLAAETANAEVDVKSLIEMKQFDKAGARIEEFKLLYQAIHRPLPEAKLKEWAALVQAGRRRAAYDDAMEAFMVKDWRKFLELTQSPAEITAAELDPARLAAMRQDATDNMIHETLGWFIERENAFKTGTLSAEDAVQAVSEYPAALKNVAQEPALTTATLLFDLAVAHVKLGQPRKALDALQELGAKYPKSSPAKASATLRKKLEAELAPPPAPEAAKSVSAKEKSGAEAKKASEAEAQAPKKQTTRRRRTLRLSDE